MHQRNLFNPLFFEMMIKDGQDKNKGLVMVLNTQSSQLNFVNEKKLAFSQGLCFDSWPRFTSRETNEI